MKKIVLFALLVPLHILAQDITNTLGTDGHFTVEDNANKTILLAQRLSGATARIIFGDYENTFSLPAGDIDFIQNSGGENVNLVVGRSGASSAYPKLQFYFTPSPLSTPTSVVDLDVLGRLNFGGYLQNYGWQSNAFIHAEVDGTPGTTFPTLLRFGTRDGQAGAFNEMTYDHTGSLTVPAAVTSQAIRTVNTSTTLAATDQTVVVSNTANTTITLPTPSAALKGKTYTIKNKVSSGSLTISGPTETPPTFVFNDCVMYQCDGTQWIIISMYKP